MKFIINWLDVLFRWNRCGNAALNSGTIRQITEKLYSFIDFSDIIVLVGPRCAGKTTVLSKTDTGRLYCMFNQKMLLGIAILSSSFMGFEAAHAVDYTQSFNAPYIGLYGDAISVSDQWSFADAGPAMTISGNGNKALFGGGLFAGLGGVFNCNWYLGGEAFAQTNTKLSTLSLTSGTNNWTLSHSGSNYSWGAQARGGYFINGGTLAFLSMGFIGTHYNYSATDVVGGTVANIHNTSYAPLPGVGIEAAITPNFHIRTAYTYAWYGSSSATNGDLSLSTKPQRGQFSLGLSYSFFC